MGGREQIHGGVRQLSPHAGTELNARFQRAGHDPHSQSGSKRLHRKDEEDQREVAPVEIDERGT
jgi:hypothetical protein